jgi:hypothetical protein
MAIPIEPEDKILCACEQECCVFCNSPTIYWAVAVNRPVCPQCSVKFDLIDVPYAKYAY